MGGDMQTKSQRLRKPGPLTTCLSQWWWAVVDLCLDIETNLTEEVRRFYCSRVFVVHALSLQLS